MAKHPDLLSRFDAALSRLQPKAPDVKSDRQRPIVQRNEHGTMRSAGNSHLHAVNDAASALARLWKTRR